MSIDFNAPEFDPFARDMPNEVRYAANEYVCVITLNRPADKNAIDERVTTGLFLALARIKKSPKLRVVFITGEGNMFCAGGDPKEFQRVRVAVCRAASACLR